MMTARMLGSVGTLASLAAIGALMAVPASGQGRGTPPLVITAFGGAVPDFAPPRT